MFRGDAIKTRIAAFVYVGDVFVRTLHAMTKSVESKKSQVERFREAAHELKTDDREEAFDRTLGVVARFKDTPAARAVVKKLDAAAGVKRKNPK
jgi:hypothetical protein